MNDIMDPHEEYHHKQMEAQKAHRSALEADNMVSESRTFNCYLSPGDSLAVRRVGIPSGKATHISLTSIEHGQGVNVALTVMDARRLAAALLDLVEEADPARPVMLVPDVKASDAE